MRPVCYATCRPLACSRHDRANLAGPIGRAARRCAGPPRCRRRRRHARRISPGRSERISPEAPVPVVRVKERKLALGGAANVANNIVAIGARCELVAAVGATSRCDARGDARAGQHRNALARIGGRPTTTKTRVVARSQQVVRYDEEDDADLAATRRGVFSMLSARRVGRGCPRARGLQQGSARSAGHPGRSSSRQARRSGGRRPEVQKFFSYRGATIFKPNRRELESALGAEVDLEHPEALPATFERLGVEHLLLTLGERGWLSSRRTAK